jgi:hypothetical protein
MKQDQAIISSFIGLKKGKAFFCLKDTKGEINAESKEVPVFCNKDIRTNPFCICRNEGISRLQALGFVFCTQFEWDNKVFVDSYR